MLSAIIAVFVGMAMSFEGSYYLSAGVVLMVVIIPKREVDDPGLLLSIMGGMYAGSVVTIGALAWMRGLWEALVYSELILLGAYGLASAIYLIRFGKLRQRVETQP